MVAHENRSALYSAASQDRDKLSETSQAKYIQGFLDISEVYREQTKDRGNAAI